MHEVAGDSAAGSEPKAEGQWGGGLGAAHSAPTIILKFKSLKYFPPKTRGNYFLWAITLAATGGLDSLKTPDQDSVRSIRGPLNAIPSQAATHVTRTDAGALPR